MRLNLPECPTLTDLSHALRRVGVGLRAVRLGPETTGAWLGSVIIVNSRLSEEEQLWAGAHELGHGEFDTGNELHDEDGHDWVPWARRERRAELHAGALLMGELARRMPAWWLAERHRLPWERVARWKDLDAGWLAISSHEADLERYRSRARREREVWARRWHSYA